MTYLTGLKPDVPDSRDYLFSGSSAPLPPSVDLRIHAGGIEQQGGTNSCTANAGVSACEIWAARAGEPQDFSRLFLYYNERAEYPALHGKDGGAYMRDICRCLNKQGVCRELVWPFDLSRINQKPGPDCYEEAANYKVGRYERIAEGADQDIKIKAALAAGCPVLVGMHIRKPFLTYPAANEYMWFINTGYPSLERIGSHAMLIVGYDDKKGHWLIENSWGSGWGDQGYAKYPYGYFGLDVHDLWVFTEFADYQLPDADRDTVARLYKATFNRTPDADGLHYWTQHFKQGMSLKDIARQFCDSQEFKDKYGAVTDDQFVALLYQNVLKREPDSLGAQFWAMALNPLPKHDRVDVLVSFSESPENMSAAF